LAKREVGSSAANGYHDAARVWPFKRADLRRRGGGEKMGERKKVQAKMTKKTQGIKNEHRRALKRKRGGQNATTPSPGGTVCDRRKKKKNRAAGRVIRGFKAGIKKTKFSKQEGEPENGGRRIMGLNWPKKTQKRRKREKGKIVLQNEKCSKAVQGKGVNKKKK